MQRSVVQARQVATDARRLFDIVSYVFLAHGPGSGCQSLSGTEVFQFWLAARR